MPPPWRGLLSRHCGCPAWAYGLNRPHSRCSTNVLWTDEQMSECCLLFFSSTVEMPPQCPRCSSSSLEYSGHRSLLIGCVGATLGQSTDDRGSSQTHRCACACVVDFLMQSCGQQPHSGSGEQKKDDDAHFYEFCEMQLAY